MTAPLHLTNSRRNRLTAPLQSAVSGLLAVLCFMTLSVTALAGPTKFDIPAQAAPDALQLFIKQSGTQVMFVADELKAVTTNAVTGEHEPAAALSLLLQGTGYTSAERKSGWFTVVRAVVEKHGSIEGVVRAADSGRGVAGARVEIAGTDKFVLTDKRGRFTFDEAPTGDQELQITAEGMQNTKVTDVTVRSGHKLTLSTINVPIKSPGIMQLDPYVVSAKKNEGVIELDPFSVEGQRAKPFYSNMDVPRTVNDAQPYYIFEAGSIGQSGATNVEDFLKERLTMNASAITNAQIATTSDGNNSSINLRGLGADKTLVLVNGRRMPGVVISSVVTQPDVNGIPLSAIERIEVLPSSASGIYGGSAIGGVVNIILKRNYTGGEVQATYGNTWHTDAPTRNLSFNYGVGLEGGRSNIMLRASWNDSSALLLQDRRALFERNIATIQQNAPTYLYSSFTPYLGALPNIAPNSSSQSTLTLKNGTVLPSRNTFISAGISPTTPAATLNAALAANSGRWDFTLPPTQQSPTGLLRRIGSQPEVQSFQASVRRQMTQSIEMFADFAYNQNQTESVRHTSFQSAILVSAASPINPFTTAVRVRVPDASSTRVSTDSSTSSWTIGAILRLPGKWTAEFDYTRSRNYFSYVAYDLDAFAVQADVASGVLNPFVDTLAFPLNASKYVARGTSNVSTTLDDLALRASGPLWSLPWGAPQATVGLGRRIENRPEYLFEQKFATTTTQDLQLTRFAAKQVADSVYSEVSLPLVREDRLTLVHSLALQLSGRVERYTVEHGTPSYLLYPNSPQLTASQGGYGQPTLNGGRFVSKAGYTSQDATVGLKYQPIPEVIFRLSRATAFLPPTPDQVIRNPQKDPYTSFVIDPKNPGVGIDFGDPAGFYSEVSTLSGGNPNIKPQNSRSLNGGVIVELKRGRLAGLRFNAEYYKIQQFDAIIGLDAQTIVNQESLFPGRVTRDSNGLITLVDISYANLYSRETEGWDFSAGYERQTPIGKFGVSVTESLILHLKNQYARTLPAYDSAGFPSEGGAAKRKSNATLNWEWRGFSAGWTIRYFGSYKQYGAAGGPNSVQNGNGSVVSTTYLNPQGGDTIPSQTYHDLYVGYAIADASAKVGSSLGRRMLDGLSVQVGVRNLMDKAAPFDAFYSNYYYLSPYSDIRLRSYWLSVRKAF